MSSLDLQLFKGNAVRYVTSVQYSTAISKMINNITFLYNPSWNYGDSEESTLPICFYFVKGWHETGEGEINQRPMMFYNSQKASATSSVTGAVMHIVADNNIIHPKTYKLDVLVPFKVDAVLDQYQLDVSTQAQVSAFSLGSLAGSIAERAGGGEKYYKTLDATLKGVGFIGQIVHHASELLRLIFSAMSVKPSSESFWASALNQADGNKVSLDAMRTSRSVLKMKMWNGWRFKYVMIKSIDLSKSGEMDGFYEGSITVQEVPILNVGLKMTDVGLNVMGTVQQKYSQIVSGLVDRLCGEVEAATK